MYVYIVMLRTGPYGVDFTIFASEADANRFAKAAEKIYSGTTVRKFPVVSYPSGSVE